MGRDPHREYEEWCRRRLDAALLGTTQTVAIPAGNSRGAAAMTEPKTLRILSGLDAPLTRAYVERWWGVRLREWLLTVDLPAPKRRRAARKRNHKHLGAKALGWG